MRENRMLLRDPAVLDALSHPVRLDVLGYLMSEGTATASVCARAVGDTPSNCSYHLRVLAKHGLVEQQPSSDGRERPWKATITGLAIEQGDDEQGNEAASAAMAAASLQLDQQLAREHLRSRESLPQKWRQVDAHAAYGLRVTPDELKQLTERIDAIVRPYIAATRDDAPSDAELAHLAVLAFPRPQFR
ncbi:MAG TPA: helix-turn-helix domain-containing protein [Microbacteriaceae bacterium]|jgi:DNA-binding transcriptional ArsR family regulator|nr:helix-turn-helix domain-containing protein [Microbacteriaceae bacterium]